MVQRIARMSAVVLVGAVLIAGCGSKSTTSTGNAINKRVNSADFGTLKNVCHKAKGVNKPKSDRGVTANSLQITTISDAGSTLQAGLNQELWDAATVFTRWCNENGGINGRRILMTKGNAQVVQYKQTVEQACATAFALVGGGGALDNQGQEARLKCLLPAVPGFVASAQARGAPLSFPALANTVPQLTIGDMQYLVKKFGANEKVAAVYGDFETTKFTRDQQMTAARGMTPPLASSAPGELLNIDYPIIGERDWQSIAQQINDSGATGLMFTGQPPDFAALMNALANSGKSPVKWAVSFANMYDQTVINSARAALSRIPLYTAVYLTPFEITGDSPQAKAIDEYQALFKKYLPNGKFHTMLGISGFSAWLLFAQAANECGTNLTRRCLVQNLHKVNSFDAGGLIAPRDPSNPDAASQCYVLMKGTDKGFEIVKDKFLRPTPGKGVFTCDPKSVYTFTPSAEPMKRWFDELQWTTEEAQKLEGSLP